MAIRGGTRRRTRGPMTEAERALMRKERARKLGGGNVPAGDHMLAGIFGRVTAATQPRPSLKRAA